MNKRFISQLFLIFLTLSACTPTSKKDIQLNLDFEKTENGLPSGWFVSAPSRGYSVSLDSIHVKSGKYSICIEITEDSDQGVAISFELPYNYEGKKLLLSGYVKTENVNIYAGLLIISPGVAVARNEQKEIFGTTDWTKYEVTLDLNPQITTRIFIRGGLIGKGKLWIDDLNLTIDGKDIRKVKPIKTIPFSEKARNDKEFDKGSNIVFPVLNEQKIDDLELLGRIWGFLKYHHPAIAKGYYNWDYELFRFLPTYLNANNNQQRDDILLKWINKYGRIPECSNCRTTPDNAFLKPDLSWIDNGNINLKLRDILQKIYLNRSQGAHYYINIKNGIPLFSNEKAYIMLSNPDAGFRLLSLYRYWNIIQYFSPYRYLTDKDWNIVLKQYIPYFIEAKERLEYELAVILLLGESCDSHAYLNGFYRFEASKGFRQVPASIKFIENKLVVTDYYNKNSSLKKGDIIIQIDGKSVEAIVDSIKNYYPASNDAERYRKIANDLLRSCNSSIQIDYIRNGIIEQKEIILESRIMRQYNQSVKVSIEKCYRFIDKDVGYISLGLIKAEEIPVVIREFMNTKGIIVDIRNYPSKAILSLLSPFFVSQRTPYAKNTIGNTNNPGEFIFTEPSYLLNLKETYKGKLVVIVNEETLSNAEVIAMALHAGDYTIIIGSQTAGALGKNPEIILPGGLRTSMTGIGFYYPDGSETQRIGIVPDIIVNPTIKGVREGRDELLEKAIDIIKNE